MSTHLNTLAAHDAVGATPASDKGTGLSGLFGRWLDAWRRAMALRRTLNEISMLSDRELTDIGLAHDEILRLRASETFMPRGWRSPKVQRGDLPI